MKTMTCKQLGGACDLEFTAGTFEEVAEMSKQHGMEMFMKNDPDHLAAIQEIQKLMATPTGMQDWFAGKKKEFEALPENS